MTMGPARPAGRAIDTSHLDSLLGYSARRVSLSMTDRFEKRMAVHALTPVDFSVLSLVTHNAGITSRQLCRALRIRPPNLVGIVKALRQRDLVAKRPHPLDRRAVGLHATPAGDKLMGEATHTARLLEADVAGALTPHETQTLLQLLLRIAAGAD